jgi:carboxylesterase type B
MRAVLLLAVALCLAGHAAAREHMTVQTLYGPVVGYKNEFGGYSFLGVPFAAPPTGALRFQPPQAPAPWTAPLNCTEFRSGCPAHCNAGHKLASLMCPKTTAEDCLYLNIYTPALGAGAKAPVLHFTHGGMDEWGSGSIPLYSGSKWAAAENIVVVTTNYRENIFGGLVTSNVVGNFMIRDQIASLKFVHDAIAPFGGDATRVTMSGQSSGAAMSVTLYTSPPAYPYFQSAAPISDPIGFVPATLKMSRELGDVCLEKLKCPVGANASVELACLQNKTIHELLEASQSSYLPTPNEVLSVMLPWQPSIDGEYVFDSPITQIEKGLFNPVPLYMGTVANETIPFVMGINIDVKQWLLDLGLAYIFGLGKAKEIEALYGPIPASFNGSHGGMPFFSELLTDYTFYCPKQHILAHVSAKVPNTYSYLFDHVPSWATWYKGPGSPCTKYVCHAFDLPTIFDTVYKLPKSMPRPTAGEDKLSTFVQKAIADFMKTGVIGGQGWPRFDAVNRTVYNLTVPLPSAPVQNYRKKYCDYWDKIGYNRR